MSYLTAVLQEHMKSTPKDSNWAKEANILTRRLRARVWGGCPDHQVVERELIPALEQVHGMIMAVPHEGEFGHQVEHYAHCIAIRLIDMYRYLAGKLPYVPNEPESVSAESIDARV